jgi:hypothetical protein
MKQPGDGSRRRFLKASSMFSLAVAFTPSTINGLQNLNLELIKRRTS